MKPAHVTIHILPPIETGDLSREELKELPQRTAALIGAALKEEKEA